MDRVRCLEMLVRAAEAGSFARAAVALRITPSAVSHGIAELERRFGAPLFQRTTRQLRLTEEGEAAYRCGRDVLDRLGELEALAPSQACPAHLTGTLRVGWAWRWAGTWSAPASARSSAATPGSASRSCRSPALVRCT
jgi:DNA-binding transcriptional LysR family regulator